MDTGSPYSILNQDDAKKLMLHYDLLRKQSDEIRIAGISTKPYLISDITLTFRINEGKKPFEHKLEKIRALPPPTEVQETKLMHLPSIIGRDFLNHYTLIIIEGKQIVITDENIFKN